VIHVFGHLGQTPPIELCYFAGLAKWSNAERYKLVEVAQDIGGPPDELSAVIKVETAGTFSPTSVNKLSPHATGLIQWIPSTAKSLHGLPIWTTPAGSPEIKAMNVCAQLELARAYFKKTLPGGWKKPGDFYRAVQGGGTYHAGSEGYEKNKGWDLNKDGTITPSEVAMLAVQVQNAACATGKRIAVTPEACGSGGGVFSGGTAQLLGLAAVGGVVWYAWRQGLIRL
jgi:hypothetical protein